MKSTQRETYEVVVVGGGAAGLSAALILGRSRRSVLVVDAGEPRNAPAAHMQGFPSRDGMPPGAFLAEVRREVSGYGVELVRGRVTSAEPDGSGEFDLELADGGRVHARRLVIATGLVDELPDVPGVAERWGKDVLHCPYCHGWEVRDQPIGVLYRKAVGTHQALLFSQLSDDVTLFLDDTDADELPDDDWQLLAAAGVSVATGRIDGLVVTDDRLTGVRLASGRVLPRSVFVVPTRMVPRDGLLSALGARTEETPAGPFVSVDPTGQTSVPGVWAVGNAAGAAEQVINAASAGYRAGAFINAQLVTSDAARGAELRRSGAFSPEGERAVARARTKSGAGVAS
ncbi:NAD(P)/FAD-dependent oxidoreductase [Streptomyces sp. VRA16 Mangrove soil]|uniref:NAD(P)/FAD-dependent oxidoreductase n=1 Tax=Streptomyces sp. VRA16 Mangrove soil TaxID=2817434 RepID=UPI001A9D8B87|nr:NAD(P)/FAD-dependent oxidoreductase [Streptomyces sp. VRA16 Mangrove soil]MBO1330337.1 NAD(P)/FAD-dependent oxidoreductase [Streptomyces sp. VRA16 Mangrove soil]